MITPYAGDYQYYLDKTKLAAPAKPSPPRCKTPSPSPTPRPPSASRRSRRNKTPRSRSPQRPQQSQKTPSSVAKIEAELATLDKRKHEIVELLQDQATYADAVKFRDLSAELEAVEPKIAKLTTEWEKAAEEVEDGGRGVKGAKFRN